jgi:Phytanoyl-CoA dioxygenase (PhyH)
MATSSKEFRAVGYRVIRNLLPNAEIDEYRKHLDMLSGFSLFNVSTNSFRWNLQNGVSKVPFFWTLIFNKRLLSCIQELLASPVIKYAEQTDLKVWKHQPSTGWHRDSISDRYGVGAEWDERIDEYKIVRVAFYFQALENEFAWGVIPGSHTGEVPMARWEKLLWRPLLSRPTPRISSRLPYPIFSGGRLWIRTKRSSSMWDPPVRPIWIRTNPGDCVIFDPRLIHAGGPVRKNKYAAFLTFGADNEHSRRHAARNSCSLNGETGGLRAELTRKLHEAGLLLS